jgi:anti-anti-sigma regulatory factor
MPIFPIQVRNVMRRAIGCAALVLLVVPSGCRSPPPAPEEPVAVPAPMPAPMPSAPPIDEDRLDLLLEQGDRAFKAERLLTPIDDCAYDYYRAALLVAPDHPAALHGLERVADRYIGLAEQAAERGQFDTARSMLERARIVDAQRPGIAETEALIELRKSAKRQHVVLDAQQLAAHDAAIAAQLKQLGAKAKAEDAWVIIRARNDAEGRWIYQQLAQRGQLVSARNSRSARRRVSICCN